MIHLDHLHVIRTIIETGSFQLTAEKLHKARSAVSYSVKLVEEQYQLQLFDRSSYRAELTREGRLLLPRISHLLQQAEAFDAYAEELRGVVEAELRLGVSSIYPVERLTEILLAVQKTFPNTVLHLDCDVETGAHDLQEGAVDLAIFGAPKRDSGLDYLAIETMEMPLVIAPALLPEAAFGASADLRRITRSDLTRHPQIVVKSSDAQLPDTGLLQETQKWFVSDLHAKRTLIAAGMGWGRLPRHMINDAVAAGQVVCLPTLGEVALPIVMARPANQALGPVGRHIWAHFDQRAAV